MSDTAKIVPIRPAIGISIDALTLSGVTLEHDGKQLLNGVSASISNQGITTLIGPNGAGKSLLLRVIMDLVRPTSGSVEFGDGYSNPSLVFQRPVLLRRSVRANLDHALRLAKVPKASRSGRLAELLVASGLTKLAENPARSLSGGEQQRLSIARALAPTPTLLLLDEPTASLDPSATKAIEDLIGDISASGVKVILVTHNRAQAKRLAEDVLFLHNGKVTEHSQAESFFQSPQSGAARAYLSGDLLL